MKKAFIFLFALLFPLLLQANGNADTMCVWICKGPYSKAYHSSPDCEGLKKCSTDIFEVSLKEAKDELNRRPCRYCGGVPHKCTPTPGNQPKVPKKRKK